MSYTVTKYPQGTFCWADAMSTDAEKSKHFWSQLHSWDSVDLPTDMGMPYTQFSKDGHIVAGLSAFPPGMEGVPSHWNNYVSVENADEMIKKIEAAGGNVVIPAMDVMDQGRMVGFSDPTGAMLYLWQPKKHIGARLVNTVGAMGWNELLTTDLKKAISFYESVFGWVFEEMKGNDGYYSFTNQGRMNGGAMQIKSEWGDMPACWVPYFTVENLDQSLKQIPSLGGKVLGEPIQATVGKMAMVADPAGASAYIIQMSVPADEWRE